MLKASSKNAVYVYEPISCGCLIVIIMAVAVVFAIKSCATTPSYSIELSDQYEQRSGPKRIIAKPDGCRDGEFTYTSGTHEEISFVYKDSNALPLSEEVLKRITNDIITRLSAQEKQAVTQKSAFAPQATLSCRSDYICFTDERVRLGNLRFKDRNGNNEEASFGIPVDSKLVCASK